jgi:hypothetical protein
MNQIECVKVVKFLSLRCPSMRVEDGTADAWYLSLCDWEFDDAMTAAQALTERQPYVALSELLTETRSHWGRRIGRQRVAAIEAQIAAENGPEGQRDMTGLTIGSPVDA